LHSPAQTDPSEAHGCLPPCGAPVTGRQLPSLPTRLQASHCPVQALEQHMPSTQMLELHSLAMLHVVPVCFFRTQAPAAQYWFTLQSPSDEQVFAPPEQIVPTHFDPVGHVIWSSAGQAPAPSQNPTSVATPFWQSAGVQTVPGPA
jgi:hypothetical protein